MIASFITLTCLLLLFSVLLCLAAFSWLNRRSSHLDRSIYEDDFDAGKMVPEYKVPDKLALREPDPSHSLRKFAHHAASGPGSRQPQTRATPRRKRPVDNSIGESYLGSFDVTELTTEVAPKDKPEKDQ